MTPKYNPKINLPQKQSIEKHLLLKLDHPTVKLGSYLMITQIIESSKVVYKNNLAKIVV